MAGVDASIYGNLQQPTNPLAMAQGLSDLRARQLENQRQQMAIDAQQGEAAAAQSGIDPSSGAIDPAKIGRSLATGNPLAATAGVGLVQGAQTAQQVIQGRILENRQNAANYLGTQFGSYLNRTQGPVSADDAADIVTNGLSAGVVTPEVAHAALRQIYAAGGDPQKLRNVLAGGYLTALGAGGQAEQVPGPPGGTPGAPVNAPAGAATVVPKGAAIAREVGAGSTATTGGAPTATAPGPMVTGLPPGQAGAMEVGALGAAKAATAMSDAANRLNQGQADLANLLALSGKFTGGPITDEMRTAITALNEVTGMNINVPSIASQEEFNKIINQIALNQSAAFHPSDLTTQTSMGASPNAHLSSLGRQRVIEMLQGNNDALIIKDEAWHDWLDQHPGQEGKFFDWSRQFNKQIDPRVFQLQRMTNPDGSPSQDALDTVASLGPKDSTAYKQFRQKYNYAIQQGWIPDPRQGGGAPAAAVEGVSGGQ